MNNDDQKRQVRQILLKGEIAVDGYKNIELVCCSPEQFTICNPSPTSLRRCRYIVSQKKPLESLWYAFIEQNSHTAFTDGRISPLTSSSNSVTCA